MIKHILFAVLVLSEIAFGQTLGELEKSSYKFGLELDALPYITGGYYASAWIGEGRIRLRAVYSKVYQPKFVLPDGFKENKMSAYTFLADYFFQDNFRGPWAGAGFELWRNNVTSNAGSVKGSFNTYVFTVGGGYVWYFSKHFYLNPWAAGHLRLDSNSDVKIGQADYKTPRILGEASLKLGFVF